VQLVGYILIKYKQFVNLIRCLLALNMRKLVTYFKRARTAGNPSDIQTGFLRNKSLERFEWPLCSLIITCEVHGLNTDLYPHTLSTVPLSVPGCLSYQNSEIIP